jgi:uncharacterized protein YjcR
MSENKYDESLIRTLHNQGMSQCSIAKWIGVNQNTLSHKMSKYSWFNNKLSKKMCTKCGSNRIPKHLHFFCVRCFKDISEGMEEI